MKCRAQTHLPRALRFPVPLDKGNEGSGDEIASSSSRRRRSSFTSSWTSLNLKSYNWLKRTNLLSFVIAFNWLEILFFSVVVLKSSVRFVDYTPKRQLSKQVRGKNETPRKAGPSGWILFQYITNTFLRLVFSTFRSCSQMPAVFYHSVIHGLGFFN